MCHPDSGNKIIGRDFLYLPVRDRVKEKWAGEKMRVLIAGGGGFVGGSAAKAFRSAGHSVTILSRERSGDDFIKWSQLTAKVVAEFDGIINLSGEGIASGFWTEKKKKAILESRLEATGVLVNLLQEARATFGLRPSWLINASAIGYYGTSTKKNFEEADENGNGFLAEVCQRWEKRAQEAEKSGVRVVILRFGHVLAKEGGLLARLTLPFRWHVGGYIGSGRQWMSWIHRDDLAAMMLEAGGKETWAGIYNACAPEPVRMAELAQEIGVVLKRRCWTRLPECVLSALFGEMAEEVLLAGQHVMPLRAQENGFVFRFASLKAALRDIYK